MNTANCIIIDDEINARQALEGLIKRYFSDKINVLELCKSVQEGVKAINKHQPDIVFLDIEMPHDNGFELFKYFKSISFEVVFTTAHRKYAIDAIKHAAFDYLLKPVNIIELGDVLNRFQLNNLKKQKDERLQRLLTNLAGSGSGFSRIALPTITGYQLENYHGITHCIAEENYSRIFTVDGRQILASKNLGLVQELLPEKLFFRIHKSYLVNLNFVKSYSRYQRHFITLEDGTELDVAKRRIEDFVQAISSYTDANKL
ncbi:MAG: LytTR family DNA-binding domain-containing protein [Bacteroidales bacterium]|jgi:two-component system LytT family response regulator|nr:LytTR family DNA-binding domain-containing protein [Bacteroidales bacterium]